MYSVQVLLLPSYFCVTPIQFLNKINVISCAASSAAAG